MEEIKIWAIDGSEVTEVQRTDQTESEQWLEENLVSKPELLIPGLALVGRQTQTEGGPLDLLGVDSDGRLVVFELKRGTLSRDAVAQIIDYASYLESMNPGTLANYIASKSGSNGIEKIDDFGEWHAENTEAESLDSLLPLRAFLVGLGVDDKTERMVNFLADKGMDITLLTFYGFKQDGKTLLARQVRVQGDDETETRTGTRRLSREERLGSLVSQAKEFGVYDLFNRGLELFRVNWPNTKEHPISWGLNFQLRRPNRLGHVNFARVDPTQGRMGIVFFPRAIELCKDKFKPLTEEIQFSTSPQNRENEVLERSDTEIQFWLTEYDWKTHREKIEGLTRAVYEALNRSG